MWPVHSNIRVPRDPGARWNLRGGFSFEPRYNIAPSQSVPVIVKGEQGNEVAISLVGLSCEAGASLSLSELWLSKLPLECRRKNSVVEQSDYNNITCTSFFDAKPCGDGKSVVIVVENCSFNHIT
jgi:hypothetical protein